ncbi:unnamed protein product [Soboliphyme baturini]|uniref:Uncharacterized protein n=1 Tax=Soboliphyme baturini TaxID=241478 RepID=A0A183JA12_9BILA|nr:unnamed protein product [Soboliphyme baturini]
MRDRRVGNPASCHMSFLSPFLHGRRCQLHGYQQKSSIFFVFVVRCRHCCRVVVVCNFLSPNLRFLERLRTLGVKYLDQWSCVRHPLPQLDDGLALAFDVALFSG